MPMIWTPPTVAFRVFGLDVYHTYKDGDVDRPSSYWYTFDESESEDYEFDITDLIPVGSDTRNQKHYEILRDAILEGRFDTALIPEHVDLDTGNNDHSEVPMTSTLMLIGRFIDDTTSYLVSFQMQQGLSESDRRTAFAKVACLEALECERIANPNSTADDEDSEGLSAELYVDAIINSDFDYLDGDFWIHLDQDSAQELLSSDIQVRLS